MDQPPAYVVDVDRGGQLGDYVMLAGKLDRAGVEVRILRQCFSSCTLLVSVKKLCVGPQAVLGFHSASESYGSPVMLAYYPPKLKRWLDERGGLTPDLKYLAGRELHRMFPSCSESAARLSVASGRRSE